MSKLIQCSFCTEKLLEGQEGLKLKGHYICQRCERKIINSTPQDKSYFLLKEKIKNIWVVR